jgi:hypothetical protein
MTGQVDLGAQLQQQVLDTEQKQVLAIVNAARSGAVSTANCFVFFAAFDGTNNDLENAGNAQNTNVAQLFLQAQAAEGTAPNLQANYYPGPGTKGTQTESTWLGSAVTAQVIGTAEKAYQDFAREAAIWLEDHAGGSVTAVLTAFSRGVASAAIFTQMLDKRGLIDPTAPDKVLIPAGQIEVTAGVIFDPVATGVAEGVAFAPNVSNIVAIRAQDEYRQLFRAVDYSSQACVTTVAMLGNHCDIGGGYDNGIAALALQAATTFFNNSGVPIGPVDVRRRFGGVGSIAIHTEEVDDQGRPKWDVYLPGFESTVIKQPSPRLFDPRIAVKPLR